MFQFTNKILQFSSPVCAHCPFDGCGLRFILARHLFFLTKSAGSAPSLEKTLLLLHEWHNLCRKSKCSCFALWNCAACVQCSSDDLSLDVWCGHTAVHNSIDLSPESKKHWFFRTGSILPFLSCTFSLQQWFVLSFHKCSVPSVRFFLLRLFLLPACACAFARNQRSMVAKSRKADRHAVVNTHFPVVSVSLACDHVVQAVSGLVRRLASPVCRGCHRLIRSPHFQQFTSSLGPFLHQSRIRLPALPNLRSVVSTSPLASKHRITRHLFGTPSSFLQNSIRKTSDVDVCVLVMYWRIHTDEEHLSI